MKNYLPTFTFCGKIQGFEAAVFVFTNFCMPLLDRNRNEKTNCKRKNENKRETTKEKLKKKNIQQGRGNKPKMKACLNLQVIKKVAN